MSPELSFAHPPGKGLSSPVVNVIWGLADMAVGYILLRTDRVSYGNNRNLFALFAGIVFASITLSIAFVDKVH